MRKMNNPAHPGRQCHRERRLDSDLRSRALGGDPSVPVATDTRPRWRCRRNGPAARVGGMVRRGTLDTHASERRPRAGAETPCDLKTAPNDCHQRRAVGCSPVGRRAECSLRAIAGTWIGIPFDGDEGDDAPWPAELEGPSFTNTSMALGNSPVRRLRLSETTRRSAR